MIRSLRIFCDLVDTQSFTETGRRNYLTQSAVSQHLKALEEKFGHRLIDRSRQGLSPTASGRLVYDTGRDILWRYQRLERLLERPPKEVSGSLRLAASMTAGLYELPPYLTDFLRRYPKVDLKLAYLKAHEVYEAVLANQADVGLVVCPTPHSQLIIHTFKRDQLVVIVPPTHVWAKRRRISLKQLSGQPFIAMEAASPARAAIDRILERARVPLDITYEFDNLELIKRAVEVGSGIAVVPRKAVVTEARANTLKQLEILEGPFELPIGLLTRRHAERSLPAQRLITALLSSQR
jgi:DNA-binding transcriptional LysR family regulator